MKKLILLLTAFIISLGGLNGEESAAAQESAHKPLLESPQADADSNILENAWDPDSEILKMHAQMKKLMQMALLTTHNPLSAFKPSLGTATLKDMKSA